MPLSSSENMSRFPSLEDQLDLITKGAAEIVPLVTRKALSREEIAANAETYKEQVFKILDRDETEVRYNSEWLDKLSYYDMVKLMAQFTLSQMLEREHFHQRFNDEQPIALHELIY